MGKEHKLLAEHKIVIVVTIASLIAIMFVISCFTSCTVKNHRITKEKEAERIKAGYEETIVYTKEYSHRVWRKTGGPALVIKEKEWLI